MDNNFYRSVLEKKTVSLTNSCINGHHNCPSPHCEPNGCSSGIDKRSNFSFSLFFFLLLLFCFLAFFHSLSFSFRRATTMHKCLNQMPDMVPPSRTDSPGQLWAVLQGSCNAEFHPLHQQLLQWLPCPHRSDLSHVPLLSCHPCHGVKNLGLITMLVLLFLSCVAMANHSTSLCLTLEVTNGGPRLATWPSR